MEQCRWVTYSTEQRCRRAVDDTWLDMCNQHADWVEARIGARRDAGARKWARERPTLPARQASGEVVYFVARCDQWVKIGTTTDLKKRLAGLRRGTSGEPDRWQRGPLEVLITIPGGREVEFALHSRFDDARVQGSEWFTRTPEVEAFIAEQKRRNARREAVAA